MHCDARIHGQLNSSSNSTSPSKSQFGRSIWMDTKNDFVVVGSVERMDVFEFDAQDEEWKPHSTIQPPPGQETNTFGNKTVMKDGMMLVNGKSESGGGRVFVFRLNTTRREWEMEDTLVASDEVGGSGSTSISGTSFGESIAMMEEKWIVVGSPESTVGESDCVCVPSLFSIFSFRFRFH